MARQVNVLFINGWGGDWTSQSLARMREKTIAEFGRKIYAPPPVNHQETGLILRYLDKWQDDQILVGLSCGCSTINAIAQHAKRGERIPFAMYCSPSMYCGVGVVDPIIRVACEVNSWAFDFFNPGSRQLVVPESGNTSTRFERIKTSKAHGFTPDDARAQTRLNTAIRTALAA